MRIILILLISLIACSETDSTDPIDQTMKGEFRLVKAVGLVPMDVGGPDIDDPHIIEYIQHIYEYPEFAGRLVLGEESFDLYVSVPLATLHFVGTFEVLPEKISPYGHPYRIELNFTERNRDRGGGITRIDYQWCGNTLKLKNVIQRYLGIYWDLYWERLPLE